MANNTQNKKPKMDKDLNFIRNYAWDRFFKTGDITCYGMAKGAEEVQQERNKARANQPQM